MTDAALQAWIDRDRDRRDRFNVELHVIEHAAHEVESLASAFDRVGNERIADELTAISDRLIKAVKAIRDYDGSVLTDRLRDSQASFMSTVAAAFGGAAADRALARGEGFLMGVLGAEAVDELGENEIKRLMRRAYERVYG